MGCCFSCCDSSETSKDDSKETVYKYDNASFGHPVIKDQPVATVSNVSKEYQTKDRLGVTDTKLIIPKISVTLASPETNDNVVENKPYRPKLGLDNSRKKAAELVSEACEAISVFKDRSRNLCQIANFIVSRQY